MIRADPEAVRDVYDRQADVFGRIRHGSTMEDGWIRRFTDALPRGAEVLDLGCGTGDPVARRLLALDCKVTGADFSARMLGIAAQNLPEATWIQADMRHLSLARDFDGIVAWHSFFHLTIPDQRQAMPRILSHLRPGGLLLMTLGLEEGEVTGHVEDEPVYHASLSEAEYRDILDQAGMMVIAFTHNDPTCGGANVLFARKLSETGT